MNIEAAKMQRINSRYQISESGCWRWTGAVEKAGYGVIRIDQTLFKVHRLSYALNIGPIPDRQCVKQTCGERTCINPAHLKLVKWGETLRGSEDEFDFEPRITRDDSGCWNWNANKNPKGYGVVTVNRRTLFAHRLSFEKFKGSIPDGMMICHHCDNPSCVNPDHLFAGTAQMNSDDMVAKGRSLRKRGPKLTHEDVYKIRSLVRSGKSRSSVASRFGVHPAYVGGIVRGDNWKRLARSDRSR